MRSRTEFISSDANVVRSVSSALTLRSMVWFVCPEFYRNVLSPR